MSERINSLDEKYIVNLIAGEAVHNIYVGENEDMRNLKRLVKEGWVERVGYNEWVATDAAKKIFANDERLLAELSKAGRRFISRLTESAELKAMIEQYS